VANYLYPNKNKTTMKTISIHYNLIWQFKNYNHIQVTKCGKIFNIQTGRQKKICVNGYSVGIWITPRKFLLESKLNNYLEKIPKFNKVESNFLNNF